MKGKSKPKKEAVEQAIASSNDHARYMLRQYLIVTADLRKVNPLLKKLKDEAVEPINRWLENNATSETAEEIAVLKSYLDLMEDESELRSAIKSAEATLDAQALAQYPQLSEADTKALVVDDKWLAALSTAIHGEMDRISQTLTQRVKELADRYDTPMPQMASRVAELEARVNQHLEKMGFVWN